MKDDRSIYVLWGIAAGFAVGIALRSFFMFGWGEVLFTFFAGILVPLPWRGARRAGWFRICILIFLLSTALGITRMNLALQSGDPILSSHIGEKVTLEGFVSAEPDVREKNINVTVDDEGARVLVIAPNFTRVQYGDKVRVSGTLKIPEAFDTGSGHQFKYQEYLAKDGILYQLQQAQVEKEEGWSGNYVLAGVLFIKQKYMRGLQSVLPEPEAGLAAGITVGDKRSVGSDLSQVFQKDSLTHMLVLSGYNITIVGAAVMKVLSSAPRTVGYAGGIFTAIFFVLVSGGGASAIRAALMAMIALFARATHRLFDATRALLTTILVLLLWNPWLLIFDPSFQLSVLATFGLIFLTPIFECYLQKVPKKFGIRELCCATLGAQIAVLPLLLWQNGTLSLVALPANVLTLIAVPVAMLASFIAAIGGMLFGSAGFPIAAFAYILLAYIIQAAQFFAALPYSSVRIPAFSGMVMLLVYGAMMLYVFFSRNDIDVVK